MATAICPNGGCPQGKVRSPSKRCIIIGKKAYKTKCSPAGGGGGHAPCAQGNCSPGKVLSAHGRCVKIGGPTHLRDCPRQMARVQQQPGAQRPCSQGLCSAGKVLSKKNRCVKIGGPAHKRDCPRQPAVQPQPPPAIQPALHQLCTRGHCRAGKVLSRKRRCIKIGGAVFRKDCPQQAQQQRQQQAQQQRQRLHLQRRQHQQHLQKSQQILFSFIQNACNLAPRQRGASRFPKNLDYWERERDLTKLKIRPTLDANYKFQPYWCTQDVATLVSPSIGMSLYELSIAVVDGQADTIPLFHGTDSHSIPMMFPDNIDWRVGGGALGKGFYSAFDPNTALEYARIRTAQRRNATRALGPNFPCVIELQLTDAKNQKIKALSTYAGHVARSVGIVLNNLGGFYCQMRGQENFVKALRVVKIHFFD